MGAPMLCTLQHVRSQFQPPMPFVLQGGPVTVVRGDATAAADPSDALVISRSFPLTYGQPLVHLKSAAGTGGILNIAPSGHPIRVGVVFSGRQSPGGHNVIAGLFDALKAQNGSNILLGFVGGTEGLFAQKTLEITEELLASYRNQGGYDMLGRTKDQIRSLQQVNDAKIACEALKLDALVIIGGCGSNTDAAQLAETFASSLSHTKVIGIPVTIDGDLKNQFVETDVGFDTICKVYSQLISNICSDALSAEKYYYFIRLMGRRASHVTLECALQSHPNMVILGEEVSTQKVTLFDITKQICDVIQARSEDGKNHGVILLPEGLIENIPEIHALLQEINDLLRQDVTAEHLSSKLSPWASALFEFLPPYIKKQLLLDRESDGSVQLSQIETEKLLAQLVEREMTRRTATGIFKGKKFNAICHFFGYQARGSLPSNFDSTYAYALGKVAFYLAESGLNGYMATVTNLKQPASKWRCGGAPITLWPKVDKIIILCAKIRAMMTVKRWLRGPGVSPIGKPAVHPAKVDLKGKPYELLVENASVWHKEDLYRNPGPIQFEGVGADLRTVTLSVEDQDYSGRINDLKKYLDKAKFPPPPEVVEKLSEVDEILNNIAGPTLAEGEAGVHVFHSDQVKELVKPGCPDEVLKAALSSMASVTEVLTVMSSPSYGVV